MVQMKNVKFYFQAKLGQRGAEMVEYALVLACVCVVGAAYYALNGSGVSTLKGAIDTLWTSIGADLTKATTKS